MINKQDEAAIIAYLDAELAKSGRELNRLRKIKWEAESKASRSSRDFSRCQKSREALREAAKALLSNPEI
tara:strand:- start:15197 stop:15406 length:210 start_codon:yes stop_codon:yes gene_type:complete